MTNRYKYLDAAGEHLHTLDGRPLIGTSRVGSILAKPLAWYGSGKAVEVFGCPDPKVITKLKNKKATAAEKEAHRKGLEGALAILKQCDIDQYAALVDKAYRAHDVYKRERAKTGTDLHAECERFVKDRLGLPAEPVPYAPQIQPFIEWVDEKLKRFLWSEGHCYSEVYGLGGISDAGAELKNGKYAIIDFKSTREAYVSQFIQLAGYDLQIRESGIVDSDGNHIYSLEKPIDEYYIFAFGGDDPKAYPYYDVTAARSAFLATLELYKFLPQENSG